MIRYGVGVSADAEFPSVADCRRTALVPAVEIQLGLILPSCNADDLVERIPFVWIRLPAAKYDIRQFIKPEHPKGQLEAFRIDDLRQSGEMSRIFIMRIKDDDAQLRPRGQRLLQQKTDRSRLAGPGRPQHSKVTPDQFADVDLAGISSFWLNLPISTPCWFRNV